MSENIFQGKAKFFDNWANFYDVPFTSVVYQAIHQRLLEYVQLPDDATILDLGCGTGKLLNRLAKKYPHIQGFGLDLSSEMIAIARRNNQFRPRLIYLQGNAQSMPFAPQQFEAVFNTISFLHYPHPEAVLAEVSQILTEGGHFYLVDSLAPLYYNFIPFSPGGIRFYDQNTREKMAEQARLKCQGHHHLFGSVVLSIFTK